MAALVDKVLAELAQVRVEVEQAAAVVEGSDGERQELAARAEEAERLREEQERAAEAERSEAARESEALRRELEQAREQNAERARNEEEAAQADSEVAARAAPAPAQVRDAETSTDGACIADGCDAHEGWAVSGAEDASEVMGKAGGIKGEDAYGVNAVEDAQGLSALPSADSVWAHLNPASAACASRPIGSPEDKADGSDTVPTLFPGPSVCDILIKPKGAASWKVVVWREEGGGGRMLRMFARFRLEHACLHVHARHVKLL
jgi:hypothetical protein